MKRIISIILIALLALSLFACGKETEPTDAAQRLVVCAISYPTLLEDGGIQMSSCMEEYEAKTLEDALKGGLNGKTEVTFDEEGNIATMGGITAVKGETQFMVRTMESTGRPAILTDKPADIVLEDYTSYEVYYATAEGEELTYIEDEK